MKVGRHRIEWCGFSRARPFLQRIRYRPPTHGLYGSSPPYDILKIGPFELWTYC